MKLPNQFTTANRPDGVELENLSKYVITESGEVWSAYKDRLMTPAKKDNGYRAVFLTFDNGFKKWFSIHRLVAMAYIPNPDNLPVVMHLDNDPGNNHVSNLKWGTHKENSEQAKREGRFNPRRGGTHHMTGKTHSDKTRQRMSKAKIGERHPKFKGYYTYEGKKYASAQALADHLGTYAVKIHRMVKSGEVSFSPVGNLSI